MLNVTSKKSRTEEDKNKEFSLTEMLKEDGLYNPITDGVATEFILVINGVGLYIETYSDNEDEDQGATFEKLQKELWKGSRFEKSRSQVTLTFSNV